MGAIQYRLTHDEQPAATYMAEIIGAHLGRGERVLWLLSGGSAITVAVMAAQALVKANAPLGTLVVSLIDERYGEVGHADSNWAKLEQAGFALPGAELHPVLTGKGMEQTTRDFEAFLARELQAADFRLGLLGIGTDGHTSGILPGSPAVDAPGLAFSYEGPDFRRVTTTAHALGKLDEAVLYAVDPAKHAVLAGLEQDLPAATQPMQILKTIPKLVVFSDYKGENS